MNRFLFLIFFASLTACATSKHKNPEEQLTSEAESDGKAPTSESDTYDPEQNSDDYNFATYFVVIADTNTDYAVLDAEMYELQRKLEIPVDTMGRSYNADKDLIALPDDDEDEIYAGDYFPRRFPSETLSLEYLNFYLQGAGNKTIALVSGIYEKKEDADRLRSKLKKTAPKTFVVEARIYVGCMH